VRIDSAFDIDQTAAAPTLGSPYSLRPRAKRRRIPLPAPWKGSVIPQTPQTISLIGFSYLGAYDRPPIYLYLADIAIRVRSVNRPYPKSERYAHEAAWREDSRRIDNGTQFLLICLAALSHPVSRNWKGYWQRRVTAAEAS
jgi:hypothetical protein